MAEDGDKTPASPVAPSRIQLLQSEVEGMKAEEFWTKWTTQDQYLDVLEGENKQLQAELEKLKESEERMKSQCSESQRRDRILVRRLAAKEQEIQDYIQQIAELKASQVNASSRPTLVDPAVNLLIIRLKQELQQTKAKLEETQNELSAWKFTPDSNTGKKLMAKCRLLHQENEELGRMTSSGRIAKLEGELALQKSFNEEVKKSQSELDEIVQALEEDVEGMQSTILFLQQELRAARSASPSAPGPFKRRRASVLSLDYNEEEEPLTNVNGEAD